MTGDELLEFLGGAISTHTLTWSVTGLTDTNGNKIFISTHTLTWSVTQGAERRLK